MFSRVSLNLPIAWWGLFWGLSISSNMMITLWLRRFNLTKHEKREVGLYGMALTLLTIPVYFAAAASKIAGRKLVYAVTAKGDCTSPDSIRTFGQHLIYVAWSVVILTASFSGWASSWPMLRFWAITAGTMCLAPVAMHYLARYRTFAADRAILTATRQKMLVRTRNADSLQRAELSLFG